MPVALAVPHNSCSYSVGPLMFPQIHPWILQWPRSHTHNQQEFQRLGTSGRNPPNTGSCIFCAEDQPVKPAFVKSQNFINSISPSNVSSYWSAWKSFCCLHNQYNINFPIIKVIFSELRTSRPDLASSHPQLTSLPFALTHTITPAFQDPCKLLAIP